MAKKEKAQIKSKSESAFQISPLTERVWIGVIILLTFIVYSNIFGNEFCWDDHNNVVDNRDLKGSTWNAFLRFIFTANLQMFTPVTNFTYFLNYHASKLSPAFYHFTNLLLHLIAVLLLYKFIKLLSGRVEAAIVGSLLFAIHPMNVETVTWISARSTLMYCIFLICSLLSYIRYIRFNERKAMVFALVFFALSALAKSAAVVLPLLLFAIDWYEKRKLNIRLFIEKIPFVLIAGFFGWLTIHIRFQVEVTNVVYDKFSLIDKFFLAAYSLSHYMIKFFAPVNLCCAFGTPTKVGNYLPAEYYYSTALLPVLLILFFRPGNYKRLFQFGIAFYVISLALVLQIIPFGRDLVADRYAYLPYIGICFTLGVLISDLFRNKLSVLKLTNKNSITVLSIVVITFSLLTYNRNEIWKSDIVLFEDAIQKKPDNYFPYYFIGTYYTNYGDPDSALSYLNNAVRLNTKGDDVYINRAVAKGKRGDANGAIEDYSNALKLNSKNAFAYYNRGTLLGGFNKFKEAKTDLDSAIAMKPDYADAYFNRGMANLSLNNQSAACADWKKALDLGNEFALERIQQNCK